MRRAESRRSRPGTTLIELIVVIALLGVAMTVVGTAIMELPFQSPTLQDEILAAQRTAIERGRPEVLIVKDLGIVHALSIMPDGSVIADSSLHVDRWTGRVR